MSGGLPGGSERRACREQIINERAVDMARKDAGKAAGRLHELPAGAWDQTANDMILELGEEAAKRACEAYEGLWPTGFRRATNGSVRAGSRFRWPPHGSVRASASPGEWKSRGWW